MKIMIVDDSAAMRMIVKKTLRQAGFEGHEITEAEDGAKALAAIQSKSLQAVHARIVQGGARSAYPLIAPDALTP